MDSTPLLGLPGPVILQDHPVFLRASHSPWWFIPQNVLVFFRGVILLYLIITDFLIINYELSLDTGVSNFRLVFDFAIISGAMVLLYFIITFGWTFTHLYYPDPNDVEGGCEWWIISLLSLPRDLASLSGQFYFTLFYTVTVVFSFMNTIIYWLITRPHDANATFFLGLVTDGDATKGDIMTMLAPGLFGDLFDQGWFRAFVTINLYGITSILMTIEILYLNSIRRPFTIGAYIFGLMVIAGLYLGWATIGHSAIGYYAFFFLDPAEVGSQGAVTAYSIGFILLAPLTFIFMQGIVGIRDSLSRPRVLVQDGPLVVA